ncbi:MAG: VOC family protein [Lachnospiraceae bacterium]
MDNMYLKPLHVGISVADIEESINWYRENLDFVLISKKYMPELKCIVAFIRHAGFEIELFQHDETIALPAERFMPNSDIQIQGTKHICFSHDNVTDLLERLSANGVEVVIGPKRMEGTIMGFIHDPNGVLIEFIQQR